MNKDTFTAAFFTLTLIKITEKELSDLKRQAEIIKNNTTDFSDFIQNEFLKILEEYKVLESFREELIKRLGEPD